MLRSYLTIIFRNLRRRKVFTFINISGLSAGIASCLLIVLYVQDELSYDRFLNHSDRLYRVTTHFTAEGKESGYATAPPPLAAAMQHDLPEVQAVTRVLRWNDFTMRPETGVNEKESFREHGVYYAEPNFFDVLNYPLLAGDAKTALKNPGSLVLTARTARKYFGNEMAWQEMVGKNVRVGKSEWPCKITGIVADLPAQSHFHFDMLLYEASMFGEIFEGGNWGWPIVHTYALLNADAAKQPGAFAKKLNTLVPRYVLPYIKKESPKDAENARVAFALQPVTDIHLNSNLLRESEPNSQMAQVYIFSLIAVFILLIACVNFMNLSTAQSAQRAREVGVRKVLGSEQRQLIGQFLLESLLLTGLSTALAMVLITAINPVFSQLVGKSIVFNPLAQPWLLACIAGLTLIVGLVAGSYPAFYLTRFRPQEVLKGKLIASKGSYNLRNGLVVFQFALSIGLIICTLLVYQQLRFIQEKNPGFDKENILVIHNGGEINEQEKEAFAQALSANSAIANVSFATSIPAQSEFHMRSFNIENSPDSFGFNWFQADEAYLKTMGLQLAAGRGFARHLASDTAAVLLNEAAVRELGLKDPVGRYLILNQGAPDQARLQVIGVLKDFNFESYHQKVKPLAIQYFRNVYLDDYILVRLAAGNPTNSLAHAKAQWKAFEPKIPFTYSFLDQDFDALFHAEQKLSNVMLVFTALAIFIACLGLFGLAAFTAEQRTKEIGIRKILGASVFSILSLLSRDFVKLILVSFVIAIPIAWYAMNQWLQNFAYRIDIAWWIFGIAGLGALAIALLTVSFQAIRAALANPVKSLRSE